MTDALVEAGIRPFVVDRHGDSIQLGIDATDRAAAFAALRSVAEGSSGWYLEWDDRGRSGIVDLRRAHRHRHVRVSRRWRLFRLLSEGTRAVGRDQAVDVTFWIAGASGEMELVGTRGHERFDARSPETVETIGRHEYPGRAAFPVGSNLEFFTEPVDIVYTWVDGSDRVGVRRCRTGPARCGRPTDDRALDPARFRSRDELRYSLRSVWRNCGWVRHIYIVTAGQRPVWLGDHDRITVVDHAEILPADALPTFNSHAIESALHRIDGLAEHFVYVNDDVSIGRSVRPELFFTSNGLSRVFQSGARVAGIEDDETQHVDTAARRGRELLWARFERVVSHKPLHTVFPLRVSVLRDLEREFPDEVERTAHSRFRSRDDLSIASSFAQHYGLATGRAVLAPIETDYVHVESRRLATSLERLRLGRDRDTFCINETADANRDDAAENVIRDFYEDYFPEAAPWETDPDRP